MAKQMINPVERHFEKGVLGIAVMMLIGVIALYLVTSPNQLEMDGQKVTPSTIDARLAQKATTIQEQIRNTRVDVEIPEKLFPEFEATLAPLNKSPLRAIGAFGPDIPKVDQAGDLVGQAKLVEVFQMEKPLISFGRSTYNRENANGDFIYSVSNWVTVTSLFDVKQQSERQRLAFGATRSNVLFGPIEMQRRKSHPDGSWSDDDWTIVEAWPSFRPPRAPLLRLQKENGKFSVTRAQLKDLENFVSDLDNSSLQWDLIRPLMLDVTNGSQWRFTVITSFRDVLMQDDEYLFPDEPPSTNPHDRYEFNTEASNKPDPVNLTRAQEHAQALEEGERLLKQALKNLSVNDANRAFNEAAGVIRDLNAGKTLKDKANNLKNRASQAHTDIFRKLRERGGRNGGVAQNEDDKPARPKLPLQQVWVHDARVGSIESGGTYQYRIRVTIYNQLAGEPLKFADPQHASIIFIPAKWSVASSPVTIPPDVEFYVTSSDEKRQEVGIELYRWFEGVWVKRRRFKYTIGDQVKGQSKAVVPSWEVAGETERATINFDASATVVDIDFNRNYRDRKSGVRTRKGVKFGSPGSETAVVFVDAAGELHERLIPIEKGHPAKKSAKAREFKP